jgi:hypothetical protein
MCNSEQNNTKQNFEQYIVTSQRTQANSDQRIQVESVQSNSSLLEFLKLAESNPNISLVRIVGNADNPSRLIVQANSATINSLQSNFQGQLLFEKDQPLEMY